MTAENKNPYPFFKPDEKVTEAESRLLRLSFPAYTYVLLGSVIERTTDLKMAEALKETRVEMLERLSLGEKAEVISYGQYQQERMIIKDVKFRDTH